MDASSINSDNLNKEIISNLRDNGFEGCIISIDHLHNLEKEFKDLYSKGTFDEEFYQDYLANYLSFTPPDTLPNIKSIIVVALPDPQYKFSFTWEGKLHSYIVPPTYLFWKEVNQKAEDIVSNVLISRGYHLDKLRLPLKHLAVRGGIGKYGRNNILYIKEKGSFHRLVGFYSDMPCTEVNWHELKTMEACEKCVACQSNCPTGAISDDRFIVHQERCLTYRNEQPNEVPFPEWIDPSSHNSLIGCMICQKVCPMNKKILDWVEKKAEFSEEETSLIINNTPFEQFPESLKPKFEQFDLVNLLEVLPRNLNILLNRDKT